MGGELKEDERVKTTTTPFDLFFFSFVVRALFCLQLFVQQQLIDDDAPYRLSLSHSLGGHTSGSRSCGFAATPLPPTAPRPIGPSFSSSLRASCVLS